jgi:urease accessory protein
MPEPVDGHAALLRLLAWLSPTFPVGSFTYSHGLERAVHDGLVDGRDGLHAWIEALVEHGSAWNDAVLFAEAWRRGATGEDTGPTADLAEAMAGTRERHMESTLQGQAFMSAAAAWGAGTEALPYCVAAGATAGRHAVPLEAALSAWLQAFASSQLQAAIRLSVIGQTDAVGILARLEPLILEVAARAARSSLDDLGSCTIAAEIAAMNHETQYSRLFRS